jgi:xanthine dehydrogenase YagS FAD-binding subunit
MRPFGYVRTATVDDALQAIHGSREAKFLGGGTNLIDLMKMGVEQPAQLIDITRLPLSKIEELPAVGERPNGIRLGATALNRVVASHPVIRAKYTVLSEAILSGASPQIRNMATNGGNLLQRTRCFYFYDPSYAECNKRAPGSGCAAIGGYNRIHAILGASDQCIATHPSDMAVALTALDAVVQVKSSSGERSIPMSDFYRLPGSTPQLDTNLRAGELITAIDLPAPSSDRARSHYLKVRDRNSFAFALVSVAAVLDMDGDRIRAAHIALGGVAHKPWRVTEAERALVGRKAEEPAFRAAAEILVRGARVHRHNAFKVELARRSVVRALATIAAMA